MTSLLLVDGYNIMHAWASLKNDKRGLLARRQQLCSMLLLYQSFTGIEVLIVFDGTPSQADRASEEFMGEVKVIFSREGDTADSVIEKIVYDSDRKEDILVATSDNASAMLVRGMGARVISAENFEVEVREVTAKASTFLRKSLFKSDIM